MVGDIVHPEGFRVVRLRHADVVRPALILDRIGAEAP
jgi:hypothetical protein